MQNIYLVSHYTETFISPTHLAQNTTAANSNNSKQVKTTKFGRGGCNCGDWRPLVVLRGTGAAVNCGHMLSKDQVQEALDK